MKPSLRTQVENVIADMAYNMNEFADDSLTTSERIDLATDQILDLGVTFAPTAGA